MTRWYIKIKERGYSQGFGEREGVGVKGEGDRTIQAGVENLHHVLGNVSPASE